MIRIVGSILAFSLLAHTGCERKVAPSPDQIDASATEIEADPSIQVVIHSETNESTGSILMNEFVMRNGQTNLVRRTSTEAGKAQIRIHQFYYQGELVCDFVAMPQVTGFTTEPNVPVSVSLEVGSSNETKSIVIGTNGVVIDAFNYTNGIFSPLHISLIRKANDVGADLKVLFDPENVQKTTPKDFAEDVQDLIEKHKED